MQAVLSLADGDVDLAEEADTFDLVVKLYRTCPIDLTGTSRS